MRTDTSSPSFFRPFAGGLGKYAVAPSLDFEQETGLNIQPLEEGRVVSEPSVQVNPDYNPFAPQQHGRGTPSRAGPNGCLEVLV